MKTVLQRVAKRLSRDETRKIRKVLAGVPRAARVLDVGCGHGRKMRLLSSLGFRDLTGVEKNPVLVRRALDEGLRVLPAEEFDPRASLPFDLLVMSHIIEHMDVPAFLDFMNHYLDALRPDGHLLIVSPLPHPDFHLDLDHVKPYLPQGFKDFFGNDDEQVQAYSPHTLKLRDIRFRRSPFRIRMSRALLLKRNTLLVDLVNLLFAAAFFASFRLAGRRTGWIGLYRKVR